MTADADLLSTPAAGAAVVRGGALRVVGFLVASVLSVLSAALLFRHLGVLDTARYVSILSLVAIVGGVSDLGITQLGIRELALIAPAERGPLAREILGLRVLLSVAGLALMLVFAVVSYPPVVAAGVAIAGVGLLLQATQDNYSSMLQVELRFGWVAALDVLRQVASALFIVVLVVVGAGLLAFASVPVWAGIVVVVPAGLLVRGGRSLLPSFGTERARRLLRMVLPYSAAIIASTLYFREAIVLLHLLSGDYQLGLFSASFRVVEGLIAIPGLLIGTALPVFARAAMEDQARFDYAVGRVFAASVVIGTGLAVGLAVGAPFAIDVIGGQAFRAASGVLVISAVALGAAFVGSLWGNVLLSQRRYRELVVLNAGAVLLLGGLLAVLIPLDGARGAAVATAAAELTVAVAGGVLACRRA
ncbi:MAG: oligosaccharide flippase family protein, partial [Solirubrobacteraceae bacterium]